MRSRKRQNLLLGLIMVGCIAPVSICHGMVFPLLPAEQDQLARLRQVGLDGDRTQIPALLDALGNRLYTFKYAYKRTALHALAQIGATEALSAVKAVAQGSQGDGADVINYAKAAQARLVAEADSRGIADGKLRAATKIAAFYQQLGLGTAAINKVLEQRQGKPLMVGDVQPVEVYAAREVADMVYQGVYSDYAGLPGVTQLETALDPPAALKMRLAPLPPADRLATLIKEIADKNADIGLGYYVIQLAVDGGISASQAAADQLRKMDADQANYANSEFASLFLVLAGVGDAQQAPLLDHFMHESNVYIATDAERSYYDVKMGLKKSYEPGY